MSGDHFDQTVADDIAENHNDGSRTFKKKPGAPEGSGMYLIEQGRAAPDNDYLLEYASNYVVEVSSTPPSMKGQSEGNVAGVLNDQRIQQAFIQSQASTNNYMGFLTRRAKLWKYYWKEYWKAEDVIRVLEKKDDKDPDWVKINEIVEDEFGNVQRKNTFDDADAYDITFEDSWKSPTMKEKVLKQLAQMSQTNQDPELATLITAYSLHLSDAPQDFKNQAKALADQKRQAAEEAAKSGPPAEPLRLSMSIKSEDLHDPNTIMMLEQARAITPELAQQMVAAGPLPAEADPSVSVEVQAATAENQALKLANANKGQEYQLKAAELQMKGQIEAKSLEQKDRELAIKEGELALKAQAEQTAAMAAAKAPAAPPAPPVDPAITVAQIRAQAEIEKAHIAAATSVHTTNMGIESSDDFKKAKESEKVVTQKTKESNSAVEAVKKAQEALAATVAKQGTQIEKIAKDITKPKRVTVERDADGKITGAVASIEGA